MELHEWIAKYASLVVIVEGLLVLVGPVEGTPRMSGPFPFEGCLWGRAVPRSYYQ